MMLSVTQNEELDLITINGIEFAAEFFRVFDDLGVEGKWLKVSRDPGSKALTMQSVRNDVNDIFNQVTEAMRTS